MPVGDTDTKASNIEKTLLFVKLIVLHDTKKKKLRARY